PEYVQTLMNLPESRRKAMLYGDWNAFEGAFFPEFDPGKHVVAPPGIPEGSIRFRALDYGLDMTACLWCFVTADGSVTVYRELYESGLLLSEAAKKIVALTAKGENVRYTVASPDLWNRRQESGRSGFELMTASGLKQLIKADDARIPGWRVVREYLKGGEHSPGLYISRECANLIRCLPLLRFDDRVREDAAGTPHEITHAPEALRYALCSRLPKPAPQKKANGGIYSFPARGNVPQTDYAEFLDY
ncbi:MAG: hypothetical protein IK047_05010, partial [Clostridia bacterium]|nr:hypothetical protein [Clostridia bacterium]